MERYGRREMKQKRICEVVDEVSDSVRETKRKVIR